MTSVSTPLTNSESRYQATIVAVDEEDFKGVKLVFDNLPYPSFTMTASDQEELKRLLPNVDLERVKHSEVKCSKGVCECGRQLTLLDIVAQALKNNLHSGRFLEEIFNGNRGRLVVCSAQASEGIKEKMPANTFFVEDTAPIPCANCGRAQEVVLNQTFLIHLWIL